MTDQTKQADRDRLIGRIKASIRELPTGESQSFLMRMIDELADTTAPAVGAPVAMTEQVAQPLYDLAWKHGARQHVSFAGDELESLSFTPGEFEAFCTELSPAASAEGVTDGQIIEVAARIGSQSLNATRVHELGGDTRTILNESGVVEFARAVLSLAPAASLREQEDINYFAKRYPNLGVALLREQLAEAENIIEALLRDTKDYGQPEVVAKGWAEKFLHAQRLGREKE